MNKDTKLTWYNVTLKQFLLLQDLFKIEDETDKLFAISELILGESVTDLPLSEFSEKVKKLNFLKEAIPENTPPRKIEVNDRKYFVDCLLGNITTAQYVDYMNYAKSTDICKMMSVFLIPDGHKYNDGYDMEQVFNDINDLPVPIVNSTAFFFERQLNLFMRIFRHYSIRKIKKTKMNKEAKKKAIEIVNKSMDLV